jgi:hypothetical protein
MQRSVSNRIRVTAAFAPDDRPRPLSVFGVLVVLAVLGFMLTRATFETERPSESPSDAEPEQAAPRTTPPPEEPAAADAPAVAVPDVAVQDASIAAPAPVEAPARAPTAAGMGTITRGRVAYIRCEGVAPLPGPNPCPRDPRVELAVWDAIDRLSGCAALSGKRGGSDVRVVFASGAVSGLGFRQLESDMLDSDAVRGCLEPALRGLRSTRPDARMTASFRFDIE